MTSELGSPLYLGSNTDTSDTTGNRITLNNAGTVTSLETSAVLLFYSQFASVSNSGIIRTLSDGLSFGAALYFFDVTNAES